MLPDRSTAHVVELQRRLRAFLIATMPHEAPDSIAVALLYEIVSITAAMTARQRRLVAIVGTSLNTCINTPIAESCGMAWGTSAWR